MSDPRDDAELDAALERLVHTAGSDALDAPEPPFIARPGEQRRPRRGRVMAVAVISLLIAGFGAVAIVSRGDGHVLAPIDTLPDPPSAPTTADTVVTPSLTTLPPTSTQVATTMTAPILLDRPIVDSELCAPAYAREVDVDGLRLFAHVSTDPVPVQIIGDSNHGPTGPFAVVLRYPVGTVLPPPSTESIDISGTAHQVGVFANGNGVMQWELDDGTIGYLRSRGLDLDALLNVASRLTPRPPDAAVPGFDFAPPENRNDLQLVAESLDSDVHGRSARSECRQQRADVTSQVRVNTLIGDPVLQFAGVIDRPPPTSVTRVGDAIVVIDAGKSAPTAHDIANADQATWADLLTRSAMPEADPGYEVAVDEPVPVTLMSFDTDTTTSTLTLRLVERDGVVFLEVDTSQAVLHPDVALWVTSIEGRVRGKSSAHAGGVLGYRLGDAPLTGEVNVTIQTVDLTDTPLQTTQTVRLIPP